MEVKMIVSILLMTAQLWSLTIKPRPVKSLPCCSDIQQETSYISFKKATYYQSGLSNHKGYENSNYYHNPFLR